MVKANDSRTQAQFFCYLLLRGLCVFLKADKSLQTSILHKHLVKLYDLN